MTTSFLGWARSKRQLLPKLRQFWRNSEISNGWLVVDPRSISWVSRPLWICPGRSRFFLGITDTLSATLPGLRPALPPTWLKKPVGIRSTSGDAGRRGERWRSPSSPGESTNRSYPKATPCKRHNQGTSFQHVLKARAARRAARAAREEPQVKSRK